MQLVAGKAYEPTGPFGSQEDLARAPWHESGRMSGPFNLPWPCVGVRGGGGGCQAG